jgi:hypothetical protein
MRATLKAIYLRRIWPDCRKPQRNEKQLEDCAAAPELELRLRPVRLTLRDYASMCYLLQRHSQFLKDVVQSDRQTGRGATIPVSGTMMRQPSDDQSA